LFNRLQNQRHLCYGLSIGPYIQYKTMTLDIITPDKRIYQGPATAVFFPGVDGSFEVLDHHAAMVSALTSGDLRVTTPSETIDFQIDGGVVEIVDNKVTVLAEGVSL